MGYLVMGVILVVLYLLGVALTFVYSGGVRADWYWPLYVLGVLWRGAMRP